MKRIMVSTIILCVLLGIIGCSKNKLTAEEAEGYIREEYRLLLDYSEEKSNPLISSLYKGFDVSVQEIKASRKECTVICEISNYKVEELLEQIEKNTKQMSVEEYEKMIEQELQKSDRVSLNTEFILLKTEENFKVQFSEEQLDVAMGSFLTYVDKMM